MSKLSARHKAQPEIETWMRQDQTFGNADHQHRPVSQLCPNLLALPKRSLSTPTELVFSIWYIFKDYKGQHQQLSDMPPYQQGHFGWHCPASWPSGQQQLLDWPQQPLLASVAHLTHHLSLDLHINSFMHDMLSILLMHMTYRMWRKHYVCHPTCTSGTVILVVPLKVCKIMHTR